MWYSPLPLVSLALAFALNAHAKTFSNSFLSFTLPDTWICQMEGVAWVCTPKGPKEENDAVIVMAAKVASPEDTLPNFLAHLSKPKAITSKVGTLMPSQVMYAQERMLDKAKWVQAQHLGSEVADFYTLYVSTVKEGLAIVVTFSVEKTKTAVYNPIFDQAMKTLKITASKNLVFKNTGAGGIGVFGVVTGDKVNPEMMPPPPPRKSKTPLLLLVLGAAALFGVAVFYFYKPAGRPKKK